MKKKVWLAVLGTTAFLTACGGRKEETAETQTEVTIEEACTDAAAETDAVAEAGAKENVAPGEAGEYTKGLITDDGWESKWLGIRYAAPAGMKMSTEEEVNEIMGLGKEMLFQDDSRFQAAYSEMASLLEMMSTDEAGTVNVILTAEKLPGELTAREYTKILMQNLSEVRSAEYQVTDSDEIIEIGGLDFNKVTYNADYQGAALYQDYYVTVSGDRAVTIAVTYSEESAEAAKAMLEAFGTY